MTAQIDISKPADTSSDPRWARIVARDKTADGVFWYSVTTTGVYCRPSCASRGALPQNVRIHDTIEEARASGARPCKRCNPEGSSDAEMTTALIERACRTIETAETVPTLAGLADAAELSPAHFHRMFKAATGLTPRGYARARRAETVRATLGAGRPVTEAIHAAGFGSTSRFYEGATAMLGMKPARYRDGGVSERLRFAVGECALGTVLAASSERGVVAILLGDDPEALVRDLQDRFPNAELIGGDAEYEAVVARVIALIDRGEALDLPLDVRGTAFQQRVWDALRRIPRGRTASYAEIADAIGAPSATRAVAAACAANRHAVAIPCHRVIRTDGGLSGYRWGIERKRALVAQEQAA